MQAYELRAACHALEREISRMHEAFSDETARPSVRAMAGAERDTLRRVADELHVLETDIVNLTQRA